MARGGLGDTSCEYRMTGSAAWRLIILAGSLTHTRSSCLPKWWIGSLAADKQAIADTREIKKLSNSSKSVTRRFGRPLSAVFCIPLKWTLGVRFPKEIQFQFGNISSFQFHYRAKNQLSCFGNGARRREGAGSQYQRKSKIFFLFAFISCFCSTGIVSAFPALCFALLVGFGLLRFPSLCNIFSPLRDTVLSQD